MTKTTTKLWVIPSLLLAVPALATPVVKGDGASTREGRKLTEVAAIDASRGVEVTLKQGAPAIEVETDKNLLSYVKTEVKDGVLVVTTSPEAKLEPTHGIHVTVSLQSAEKLSGHDGAQVKAELHLVRDVALRAENGAQVKATHVDAASLSLVASGGAQVSLAGKAPRASWSSQAGSGSRPTSSTPRPSSSTPAGAARPSWPPPTR